MVVTKRRPKRRKSRINTGLIVSICVLAAALLVGVVLLILNSQNNDRIMNNTSALEGVTVNGIEISGMEREQALQATSAIPETLLSDIQISFLVEEELFDYTAQQVGITTDYEDVIDEAMSYGNTGTLEERKQAIEIAKEQGMAFTVSVNADRAGIEAVLLPLINTLDTQPQDASYTFTPWGHLADGTAFEQEQQAMIEASASGKQWTRPELVRIPENEMPNKLRYQLWRNDKYSDGFVPDDASISRFVYQEGISGRTVDMNAVVDSIVSQVENKEYAVISAPIQDVTPAVTIEDLKQKTQLIASWSSTYENHSSYNRVWNVAKLSGIVNGVVIQPGEEWSINTEAGNRTVAGGWKEASGIVDGGYVDQPGGGVCQISSTVYNAAIRADMNITASRHHSIPSDYIPFGLDATISSGGPDLKFKNPYDTPVFLVSYVNPKDKTSTVEIYGPPVVDAEYGEVILSFSFQDGGSFGEPVMTYVYNTTTVPRVGRVLNPNESFQYSAVRPGRSVETFKHILTLSGDQLAVKSFGKNTWNPQNGVTYVNGPDPATLPPEPVLPEVPQPGNGGAEG